MDIRINKSRTCCSACLSRENVHSVNLAFNSHTGQMLILCKKCMTQLVEAINKIDMEENTNEE